MDLKTPSTLQAVEIEINHDCNRACAYCPNSISKRKTSGIMSSEIFQRILDELYNISFKGRISFHFYGEPLLNPNLNYFVTATKIKLPHSKIVIYTNGTLLTRNRLLELFDFGVESFVVTRHHGIKNYPFEDVYKDLDQSLKDRVFYQKYTDMALTNRGGLLNVGKKMDKNKSLELPCAVPTTLAVITLDGNVLPCFEDYEEKNIMGNIQSQSLSEIWNSEAYTNFRFDLLQRKRSAYPVCKHCNRYFPV